MNVVENSPFQLTCTYTRSTAIETIRWSKDGNDQFIVVFADCSPFFAIPNGYTPGCSSNGDIHIFTLSTPAVSKTDEGQTWKCIVVPGGGATPVPSAWTAVLSVTSKMLH